MEGDGMGAAGSGAGIGGPVGGESEDGGSVGRSEGRAAATFEELMAELEEITTRLAAGDLGIEAAADLYERAERLHALATERLERVKTRVEGLTRSAGMGDSSGAGV